MMKSFRGKLLLLLTFLLFPLSVWAAGSIDKDAPVSLTIHAEYGETAVRGMKFYAYRISEIEENGELVVRDRYAEYKKDLDIRGENDSAWWEMAEKLERKIILDGKITPDASAKTDENGVVTWKSLHQGLYLILADGVEQDGYVYTTSAFFAVLPEQDLKKNVWNYDVTANAKPERQPVLADYQVVKVWKDDCHKNQRPESIEITLYRDGKAFETITLPENGRWTHTWKNLSVNHKWTVAEKQQKGYLKPEVTRKGNVFTVTNACSKAADTPEQKLPQTGQLWWPIPILLCTGLLCIVWGLIRRRGSQNEA